MSSVMCISGIYTVFLHREYLVCDEVLNEMQTTEVQNIFAIKKGQKLQCQEFFSINVYVSTVSDKLNVF